MKLFARVLIVLTFILTILSAQIKEMNIHKKIVAEVQKNEVDVLLEKVTQAQKEEEKQLLIENLKKRLAKKNRQAQEKSDAIMKAKKKIPIRIYRP